MGTINTACVCVCVCVCVYLGETPPINIRVGDNTKLTDNRYGFGDNGLCQLVLGVDLPMMKNITCKMAALGRYLSIQSVDPMFLGSMTLCDVHTYWSITLSKRGHMHDLTSWSRDTRPGRVFIIIVSFDKFTYFLIFVLPLRECEWKWMQ